VFLPKPSKFVEKLNVKDRKISIGNNLLQKKVLAITILKKLTWDVAPSNSRWSPNLLFLQPFKVTSSLNF
jgi:hypothetical protein